jgi:hypothetical protein
MGRARPISWLGRERPSVLASSLPRASTQSSERVSDRRSTETPGMIDTRELGLLWRPGVGLAQSSGRAGDPRLRPGDHADPTQSPPHSRTRAATKTRARRVRRARANRSIRRRRTLLIQVAYAEVDQQSSTPAAGRAPPPSWATSIDAELSRTPMTAWSRRRAPARRGPTGTAVVGVSGARSALDGLKRVRVSPASPRPAAMPAALRVTPCTR